MLQINHMIGKILMNLDNLKNVIEQSQRTQRNWDLNKSVKEEDIELFKTAVSHCPTKQNRVWYNVVIIKDRNVIEKIHDTTDGFDYPVGTSTTNTQTLANLLVVFNADKDNRERVNTDYNSYVDTSIGIASAYLNLTAHLLGYKTGYCNCFNSKEVDELLGTINSKLIIGIGHSDKNRNRQEHHLNADYIYPSFDKNIEIKII